jgi:heme-degrading monooxygenase HmoA
LFVRTVTLNLKPNTLKDFHRIVETDVVPMLRNQKGFRDQLICEAAERNDILAISLWETKEDAEAYNKTGYPEALKKLSTIINGTPRVETFVLAFSSLHKVAAKA